MLTIENLSYSYPNKDLYDNISFSIETGEHCAFIGVSGSGKSTLTNIIMDPEDIMFEGKLEIASDCTIGYVSQFIDPSQSTEITVFNYIAEPFIFLQQKLENICNEMALGENLDTLLEEYQQTFDHYESIGGDLYESNILRKLNLANLNDKQHIKIEALSGGEFKLVQIIKEMLLVPSLLIMDEPDVFLDFANLNALTALINAHKGTIFVITHNRYLLTHCFNKIIHLENKQLQYFDGRYIDYTFSLLESKTELQQLAIKDNVEIERNNALIERLREEATNSGDPSKGSSLRARLKIQERLEARRIKEPFLAIKEPNINFTYASDISDTQLLTVSNYNISFDESLLENVNFEIGPHDKVALIGANGTGKTTLLRDIFNHNPSINMPSNIEIGYLSQHQNETLDSSITVRECLTDAGISRDNEVLTNFLCSYCLDISLLDQKILALSGGEKNMLQLALLSIKPTHLLLLDEPTSHLDTYAQQSLEKSIKSYEGAVLMVSHDYYTIAHCMDYVLIIDDKTIRKMSMRKFRKTIYAKYFDKNYLITEQEKKELETQIELALKNNDFTLAEKSIASLRECIKML
ncbi:MAG: ABC-F family ATP-binding cassette domain-containing protein [Cellulosilyticaceae bacterium]